MSLSRHVIEIKQMDSDSSNHPILFIANPNHQLSLQQSVWRIRSSKKSTAKFQNGAQKVVTPRAYSQGHRDPDRKNEITWPQLAKSARQRMEVTISTLS